MQNNLNLATSSPSNPDHPSAKKICIVTHRCGNGHISHASALKELFSNSEIINILQRIGLGFLEDDFKKKAQINNTLLQRAHEFKSYLKCAANYFKTNKNKTFLLKDLERYDALYFNIPFWVGDPITKFFTDVLNRHVFIQILDFQEYENRGLLEKLPLMMEEKWVSITGYKEHKNREYINVIVPNEYTKQQLLSKGFPEKNILKLTGFNVKKDFYNIEQKKDIILVHVNNYKVGGEFYSLLKDFKNEKFLILDNKEFPRIDGNIEYLGFSNNVNLLMNRAKLIITKPGASFINESLFLNKKTLILKGYQKQEIESFNFFKKEKLAICVNSVDELRKIISKVDDIIDLDKLRKSHQQMLKNDELLYNFVTSLLQQEGRNRAGTRGSGSGDPPEKEKNKDFSLVYQY